MSRRSPRGTTRVSIDIDRHLRDQITQLKSHVKAQGDTTSVRNIVETALREYLASHEKPGHIGIEDIAAEIAKTHADSQRIQRLTLESLFLLMKWVANNFPHSYFWAPNEFSGPEHEVMSDYLRALNDHRNEGFTLTKYLEEMRNERTSLD